MPKAPPPEVPRCDFCSTVFPGWVHPADPFIMEKDRWASDGEWAACDKCHQMILSDDQDGIALRSLNTHPQAKVLPEAVRVEMLAKIQEMHAGFWSGRTGKFYRQGHVSDAQHRWGRRA